MFFSFRLFQLNICKLFWLLLLIHQKKKNHNEVHLLNFQLYTLFSKIALSIEEHMHYQQHVNFICLLGYFLHWRRIRPFCCERKQSFNCQGWVQRQKWSSGELKYVTKLKIFLAEVVCFIAEKLSLPIGDATLWRNVDYISIRPVFGLHGPSYSTRTNIRCVWRGCCCC